MVASKQKPSTERRFPMSKEPTKKQVTLQLAALMAVGPLMYYLMLGARFIFITDILFPILMLLAAMASMTAAIVTGFLIARKNKDLLGENANLAPAISCAFIPILMLNFVLMLIA